MSTITLTRGLPGSGKTTAVMDLMMTPANGYTLRLSRDDDRMANFGLTGVANDFQEKFITDSHIMRARLALKWGMDVLVDATHLNHRAINPWLRLAKEMHVALMFWDFPMPVADAVDRDYIRGMNGGRTVGGAVIRKMANRAKIDPITGALPKAPNSPEIDLPDLTPAAEWDDLLPTAWIVDTDGTLANHEGVRGPYDTSRYHLDTVHEDVANLVRNLSEDIYIIGVSGRSNEFREVTERWWLEEAFLKADEFYFRPEDDKRPDDVVKAEIYEKHIRGRYNIAGVLDDRARVLRMWRAKGLTTFAVGDTESNDF